MYGEQAEKLYGFRPRRPRIEHSRDLHQNGGAPLAVDVIDNDGRTRYREEAGRSSSVSTRSSQEVLLHAYRCVAPPSGWWEDKPGLETKQSRWMVLLLAGCNIAALGA
jgi:hypothetical protein